MTNLRATTKNDLERIRRWIQLDPWHNTNQNHSAEFLLTPGGLLCFTLEDEDGPLCYVRLDAEIDLIRMATQFGPLEEVSKIRLVMGMGYGIEAVKLFAKNKHFKGIVFESISANLIKFMNRHGFEKYTGDDYVLNLEAVGG
jgi:hypothetical protein